MNQHDCSNFNQNPGETRRSSNSLNTLMSAIVLKAKSFLSYAWQIISTPVSREPRIWEKRDRFGQTYWRAYDPETNRSASLSSEQEVRQWLEQRFYQHRKF